MEKLLNLIFIPECLFCKSIGSFFCKDCLSKCNLINQSILFLPSRTKCLFAYEYDGNIRECIRNAKYRNKHFASLKVLTRKVCEIFKPKILEKIDIKNCIIIPIPVSQTKLKKRGFNQAELIAQIFSKELHIPYDTTILKRVKDTSAQYTNSKKERFENMKGAFGVEHQKLLQGKTILLVDDVCTTGATFIEAADTLKTYEIKDIFCVSLARKSLNTRRSPSTPV
jgi:competence protein ComFC